MQLTLLTSEKHVRSDVLNPIDPEVVMPVLRYFNSINSSHIAANLLLGSLVIATVLMPFLLAIRAAAILSKVLPDIDIKYAVLSLRISGLVSISVG
jgi:hypothetical protein